MKVEVIKSNVSINIRSNGLINFPLDITLNIEAPMSWWYSFLDSGLGETISQEDLYMRFRERGFLLEDFERDGLIDYGPENEWTVIGNNAARYAHARIMELIIASLNGARDRYLAYERQYFRRPEPGNIKDMEEAWKQIMALTPQSYLIKGVAVIHICDEDAICFKELANSSPHWKKVYEVINEFLKNERSKNEH